MVAHSKTNADDPFGRNLCSLRVADQTFGELDFLSDSLDLGRILLHVRLCEKGLQIDKEKQDG